MKIFVVDDDTTARLTACGLLHKTGHETTEFNDGTALLAALDTPPDLILLDIEMPGMDGITACRELRARGDERTQVVFVSVHDDIESRLAAYDAGGNDFIVKPYVLEELNRKLAVAERCLLRQQDLDAQARFAQQAAFAAMSSMGEIGVILNFVRASFALTEPGALAATLLESLEQYGLQGMLRMQHGGETLCSSSKGCCSPLEESILDHTRELERLFQFSDRLAINYPHVTLLVTGLPADDAERAGRLRDHLAILGEGMEARLQALETERRSHSQSSGIGTAIGDMALVLQEIEKQQAELRLHFTELASRHHEEMGATFARLGLSEPQEDALGRLSLAQHEEMGKLRDQDFSLANRLRGIIRQLHDLRERREGGTTPSATASD